MSPLLNLALFGPLQVTVAGTPVTHYRSQKVPTLLAYLAVESEQPHSRDVLAALLWPDYDDQSARRNLSNTLSRLRQALGVTLDSEWFQLFTLTTHHVQLHHQSIQSDLARFQALLAGCPAHTPASPQGCPTCLAHYEETLALVKGELLEEMSLGDSPPFEEWLRLTRARVQQQVRHALQGTVEGLLAQGAHERVVRHAQQWIEVDPWNDLAHQALMQSLMAQGQRARAQAHLQRYREELRAELNMEPDPALEALIDSQPAPATALPGRPLPPRQTQLLGRESELARIQQWFQQDGSRLLTVLGLGGVGKTRLVLESAWQHQEGGGRTIFVPLEAIESDGAEDGLVQAVVDALGLQLPASSDPQAALLASLRDLPALLVLDNMEQIMAAGRTLIQETLNRAPYVKLIVTSRERLNLRGEQLLELHGLAVPDQITDPDAAYYPSVQLFLERATLQGSRVIPLTSLPDVVRLCQWVEGLPLALELSAAWTAHLSCAEIVAGLQQDLAFLDSPYADSPTRHRTLHAVIDYSWRLLSLPQRTLLAQLACFHGTFSREAALQVTGSHLRELDALHRQALVGWVERGLYRLHPLIHRFAAMQLQQMPGIERHTQQAHTTYYLELLERLCPQLEGGDQQGTLRQLAQAWDNIHTAWQQAVRGGKSALLNRAVEGLFHFCDMRSRFQEGRMLLGQAIRQLSPTTLSSQQLGQTERVYLGRWLARQGWFDFHLGSQAQAQEKLLEGLRLLRQEEAAAEQIFALNYLGAILRHQGEYEQAQEWLEESLELAERLHDRMGRSIALNLLGQIASLQGDYDRARQLCQEALALKQALQDQRGLTYSLTYLGRIAMEQAEYEEAYSLLKESRTIYRMLGDESGVAFACFNLGQVAQRAGQEELARRYFQEALLRYRSVGDQMGVLQVTTFLPPTDLTGGRSRPAQAS